MICYRHPTPREPLHETVISQAKFLLPSAKPDICMARFGQHRFVQLDDPLVSDHEIATTAVVAPAHLIGNHLKASTFHTTLTADRKRLQSDRICDN